MASVCWTLRCLISSLTQAGGGGLLFRFTCSAVLREGSGPADRYRWRVWGALAVFRPHWVCPAHGCVLSPSTLLRLQAALRERALRCVRFQFLDIPQKRRLSWACILCLPCRRSSGSQELHGREAPTPGAARLLPSTVPACRVHVPCICSWELASSHDPPGRCRPSRISGSLWLETGDLFAVW